MEKQGVVFVESTNSYAPKFLLEKEYDRSGFDKREFPNVQQTVQRAIGEAPQFSQIDGKVFLYACRHSNGFASVNAFVMKEEKNLLGQDMFGGITAGYSNLVIDAEKYVPRLKKRLDAAGLAHAEIEPDTLGVKSGINPRILASMKVEPEYKLSIITSQPREDIRMFHNNVFVKGPPRLAGSDEAVKKDALAVASITEAFNDVFTKDFLRYEESRDVSSGIEYGF